MNDESEQFERQLSRQPLRPIPPAWRGEILAAARAARTAGHPSPAARRSWLSTLNHQLSTLLWPYPRAWAGLAAVWVLILAVNFSLRDASPGRAETFVPPSPEVRAQLRRQQQLFAELLGPREERVADRSNTRSSRPQSQREHWLVG